jgi:hypothetical protein
VLFASGSRAPRLINTKYYSDLKHSNFNNYLLPPEMPSVSIGCVPALSSPKMFDAGHC